MKLLKVTTTISASFFMVLFFQQIHSYPVQDELDLLLTVEQTTTAASVNVPKTTNLTDQELSQRLGITMEFLQELRENLGKAVAELQDERNRQGIGDFFGLGGQGFGQGGGGFQGSNYEYDEYEDEEEGSTTQGPGAAGILTGLFGIFSGIGSLNPKRVIQSTVNFFPPDRRPEAQTALNIALGIHNTTTLRPLTDATTTQAQPAKVKVVNETEEISTSTPWPQIVRNLTTTPIPETTADPKSIFRKMTSLLEDFKNAVNIFQPSIEQPKTEVNMEENSGENLENSSKVLINSKSVNESVADTVAAEEMSPVIVDENKDLDGVTSTTIDSEIVSSTTTTVVETS